MGYFVVWLVLVLLIVAIFWLWRNSEVEWQNDRSGGVTPDDRAGLVARISSDEELLAVALLLWNSVTSLAGLTHRRMIILQGGNETIVNLRHVTAFSIWRTFKTTWTTNLPGFTLATQDGGTYHFASKHRIAGEAFVGELSKLLDRQSASAGVSGAGDELEKLAELVERGVIQQADFDRAKGVLLGKPVSHLQESVQMIENLYALYKQGVLSESEFNLKKWDVLSR